MPGPLLMVNPRRQTRRRNIMPGRSSFSPEIKRTYKKYFTKSGTLSKKKADGSKTYKKLKKIQDSMSRFGSWRTGSGLRKKRKSSAKSSKARSKGRKYAKPSMKKRKKATWKFGKGYVYPTKRRKPGRPKGSKNQVKRIKRRKPGRPKGSRNQVKRIKRRKPGRPKGSRNQVKRIKRRRSGKLTKAQRSKIMKSAWRKRKQGVYRRSRKGKRAYRKFYKTKSGLPFKRARKVGKSGRRTKKFQLWKNSSKDFFMTAGIATIGAIAAALLAKTLHEKVLSKNVSTAKLNVGSISIITGAAGAFLLLKYGSKISKNQNLIYGLGMGLAFFSAITIMKEYIIPQIPVDTRDSLGLSEFAGLAPAPAGAVAGYVTSGVRRYVPAPGVKRYIAAPRTMGALRDVGVGSAIGYDTAADGVERQYDKFRWQGVLSKSVFE